MLCGGVAACHMYGVLTVGCVEFMGWQHVIGMVCVLFAVLGNYTQHSEQYTHTPYL